MHLGELSLTGRIIAVKGVLPCVRAAADAGVRRVFVPEVNVAEARLVPGIEVIGVRSLRGLVAHYRGESDQEPDRAPRRRRSRARPAVSRPAQQGRRWGI